MGVRFGAACFALGCAIACGGRATSGHREVSAGDAASSSDATSATSTPVSPTDATAEDSATCAASCVGDGSDANFETGDTADAADAEVEGNDEPDAGAALPSLGEQCHIIWPQSAGLGINLPMGLAVDSAGATYVAIEYGNTTSGPHPPIDLGVPSPGYEIGIAVAKVDAQCRVVWLRELGIPVYSPSQGIGLGGFAVDAKSNVFVTGLILGPADRGAGVVQDSPLGNDAAVGVFAGGYAYLTRLDADGKTVFSKVFRATGGSLGAFSLAVTPDDTSSLIFGALPPGAGVDFGTGVILGADASRNGLSTQYFVQVDGAGAVLSARLLPGSVQLAADPGGALWALGSGADADGGSAAVLMRLTSTGDVSFSQPIAGLGSTGNTPFAVGADREVVFNQDTAGVGPWGVTLWTYAPDGTQMSRTTSLLSYTEQSGLPISIVVDAQGESFVGGTFSGTVTYLPDGAFTVSNSPVGAGFEGFDPSGALQSLTTFGGSTAALGAIGVAPDRSVVMVGSTQSGGTAPPEVFFVRFGK